MNDLPQNELLSAYLDGELTADEQAEAERLLASSPAARQLLDDLRALSATLQSLPQQKLGEDVSRQVLRVAERRMLTEGEPADAAPVPLSRMIVGRFINRRSLVWLGLIAAVAVMITINEQHQKALLVDKKPKEIAVALGDRDKTRERAAGDSIRPVTIQAAPAEPLTDITLKRVAAKGSAVEKKPGKAPLELHELAISPKPGEISKLGGGADFAEAPALGQPQGLGVPATPANATPLATIPPPPSQRYLGKVAGATGKAAAFGAKSGPRGSTSSFNWYDGDGTATIGPDVLLVFCDINPEATKKKAFYKVLAANGIATLKHGESQDDSEARWGRYDGVGNVKRASEEVLTRHLPASAVVRQRVVANNAELVYVEATPEQVKATLANLAAQPKVFVSVSIKSPQDTAARQLVNLFAMSGERRPSEGRLSHTHGKSNGEDQFQTNKKSPRLAAAKPTDTAAATRDESAAPQKENAAAAGGRDLKKMDTARKPLPPKSEKKDSQSEHEADMAQAPAAKPSFGGKSPPPATAGGFTPLAEPESQSKAGIAAERAAPSQQPAAQQGETQGARREARGRPSQPNAKSAPRQRVLFVVRIGGAPPLASEVITRPAEPAKQSPRPAPAETAPSK